jgi:hypothetical protein
MPPPELSGEMLAATRLGWRKRTPTEIFSMARLLLLRSKDKTGRSISNFGVSGGFIAGVAGCGRGFAAVVRQNLRWACELLEAAAGGRFARGIRRGRCGRGFAAGGRAAGGRAARGGGIAAGWGGAGGGCLLCACGIRGRQGRAGAVYR